MMNIHKDMHNQNFTIYKVYSIYLGKVPEKTWLCMVGEVLKVYSSGGHTCSMYEPHIVKPKLQRATT